MLRQSVERFEPNKTVQRLDDLNGWNGAQRLNDLNFDNCSSALLSLILNIKLLNRR